MDVIKITQPLYSPKQNSSSLYYKKNVYRKKKLMNSLSNINNKNPRKRNIIENENFNNFSNIRSYITKEEQYNILNINNFNITIINRPKEIYAFGRENIVVFEVLSRRSKSPMAIPVIYSAVCTSATIKAMVSPVDRRTG